MHRPNNKVPPRVSLRLDTLSRIGWNCRRFTPEDEPTKEELAKCDKWYITDNKEPGQPQGSPGKYTTERTIFVFPLDKARTPGGVLFSCVSRSGLPKPSPSYYHTSFQKSRRNIYESVGPEVYFYNGFFIQRFSSFWWRYYYINGVIGPYELFEAYLEYEGIIGYTQNIITAFRVCYNIDNINDL